MIGEIDGVKIIATPEQYKKCKKSLEEQLKEKDKEIERLNNAFDCLKQVIRYYVIDNVKYDNNTAEYILNRMLIFWKKDSDKDA